MFLIKQNTIGSVETSYICVVYMFYILFTVKVMNYFFIIINYLILKSVSSIIIFFQESNLIWTKNK